MNDLIKDISRLMFDKYQLDISAFQYEFLERIIQTRMTKLSYRELDEYKLEIQYSLEEAQTLWNELHIPYSTFFREPISCAILLKKVIPAIFQDSQNRGAEIRIWVAGCARGEEAYSLAILLDQVAKKKSAKLHYRIFASDVAKDNLIHAQQGVYPKASLANVPFAYLERYFDRIGPDYRVKDFLKDHIQFTLFNLLDVSMKNPRESVFGGFDLVTCCNVLYYYDREAQKEILDKFHFSLKADGFLLTGETERMALIDVLGFQETYGGFPIFQKKNRPSIAKK